MDGLPHPRRYWAILAVSSGNALATLDSSIAIVALPTIARDLHSDASSVVLIVTIYQLMLVMTVLPFSNLGERIGIRRMYQYGQAVFTLATLLCFFARSLPFLLVVRAAQALGAAAALSVSSALVRSIYPARQLGRGLGFNTVVLASASALAPTIGGLVLIVAPWPWVFACAVPLSVLSLMFGRNLPDPEPRDQTFDVLGAVLCAAFFGLLVSGLEALVHGNSPVVSLTIIAVGGGIGWVFVRRELREERPILPVDLMSQPVISLTLIAGIIGYMASMTLTLSLPFRLQHGYGFHPSEVGAAMAPWPLTMIFVAPTAGALSDRYPAGVLGAIGMAIATCGLILLAYLPVHPSVFDVGWRMVIAGSGFGLFLPPNTRLIIGSAPKDRAAAAGGLISTNRQFGMTLGATFFATLLALGLGEGRVPALIAACFTVLVGGLSISRMKPALRNPRRDEIAELESAG